MGLATAGGAGSDRGRSVVSEPLFTIVGEREVEATGFARGPWDAGLLHGGAVGALCAAFLEEALAAVGAYQPVRLTVDLARPVPLGRLEVRAEVVRSGARLGLARVEVDAGGKTAAAATLLALVPQPLPGAVANPPPPVPDQPGDGEDRWQIDPDKHAFLGGAMAFRFVDTDPPAMWLHLHRDVLPGRPPSPLARAAAAADVPSASTVFDGVRFDGVGFVNADLSVHLHRPPEGEWIRVSATSRWEASGIGTVRAELADTAGRVGQVSQALLLAAGLTPARPPV